MKEIIIAGCSFLAFVSMIIFATEYEHDAKMECVKFATEKQYSASDIKSICWK